MLKWNEKYSIGVPVIDEQHKKLFDIGGRAYTLLKDEFSLDKYDKIVSIIQELAEYADYHFNYEEDYMKEIGYRKFLSQKVSHTGFMEKVKSIDFNHVDDNQDDYLKGILDYVLNWIAEHILVNDKAMGEYAMSLTK